MYLELDYRFWIYLSLILYSLAALLSLALGKWHKPANILSNVTAMAASVSGLFTSLTYLLSSEDKVFLGSFITGIPYIKLEFSLDRLSAFFILALSLLAVCVSLYSIGYVSHYYGKRNVGLFNFLSAIFLLSMTGVFLSHNLVVFIVMWELMSLISFFLVIFEAEQPENRKAGILYLIMTHIGTAFLLVAFALVYKYSGSLNLDMDMHTAPASVKNIIFICFLAGFGTKAGIVPLHVWLPYAHPAAPSNVSALMSGIMIKTAVYGLIRFVLFGLGAEFYWWGSTILAVGAISAIIGVAYAFTEQNIKRLLAYSSIENIGIMLVGLGISFSAYSSGNVVLSSLALIAALIHLFNHALFKGLMFMGAGAIHYSTHTKNMEALGGLIKKMPFTGIFFLAGAVSISALPPFNGFVGEWLTYQSLLMAITSGTIGNRLIAMLTVAVLAMAGALAAASLVKCFGISFLALPRTDAAKGAKEVPAPMLLAMGILSLLCLLSGLLPSYTIKFAGSVGADLFTHSAADSFLGYSFALYYPVTAGGSTISPLYIVLIAILLAIAVFCVVGIIGSDRKMRRYGTWDCGFSSLNPRMQYSATGFSKPLRIVFRALYKPSRELHIEEGPSPYYHKSMKYVVSTEPIFEKYLYRPLTEFFTNFTRITRLKIQTGSIHTYLIYIFITILAMLVYNGMN